MKFIIEKYIPRKVCSDPQLKELRKAGFSTNGYENSLEDILVFKDFGLPVLCEDGYAFTINRKYTRIYLNYADALAGEILLLNNLGLISNKTKV